MNLSHIKAVVFDCDGVLFDTALANRKFYDELLENFGRPPLNDEQFAQVHMMTVANAVLYLFADITDHDPVFRRLKQIGYHKFIPFMKMEDGLPELLLDLAAHGYIRAVATNRTDTMQKVLKDYSLDDLFDMVVTAADVKNPKPDPEQLEKIMNRFCLHPDQVLFIGDSIYDQQAARAAGTFFAAFKKPCLKADIHARAMQDISQVLQINK
ncbi:MAG: HAD family hydrolase [Desulfotignum sp.]|nr:HAD family hydrolase [Desulfotignum sp.]